VALDPRTPVLVGVGQVVRRDPDPASASEPLDLMLEAARRAADDAGGGLLSRLDSIRVVGVLSWRYVNPGLAMGERLRVTPRQTVLTSTGGNSPQLLVNETALAIQRGDVGVALLTGAEVMATRQRARRRPDKLWLDWPVQDVGTAAPELMGDERAGTNDAEMARSLALPTQIYPVFENSVRAASPGCGRASARWRRTTRTPGRLLPSPRTRSPRSRPPIVSSASRTRS
jgi:acetyl-CoA C-acetyltransferase